MKLHIEMPIVVAHLDEEMARAMCWYDNGVGDLYVLLRGVVNPEQRPFSFSDFSCSCRGDTIQISRQQLADFYGWKVGKLKRAIDGLLELNLMWDIIKGEKYIFTDGIRPPKKYWLAEDDKLRAGRDFEAWKDDGSKVTEEEWLDRKQ